MNRTARRRWTRELQNQVDGVAFGQAGPVLVHGYDPPAGGKWVDDVIPGKLSAYERNSGELLWASPCEVGYGRGYGAGFGSEEDVIVLGPTMQGHGIARMRVSSGELMGTREIEPFDEAIVADDLCVCVSPRRVFGVLSTDMVESWVYAREGERYHMLGRAGKIIFVVYSHKDSSRKGVLCLHSETGEYVGNLIEPTLRAVHGIVADGASVVLAITGLEEALPPGALQEWLLRSAEDDDAPPLDGSTLGLFAIAPDAEPGAEPLWYEQLTAGEDSDLPELSTRADSERLYLARGAFIEVRDMLTGRGLGSLTVPGLDEYVSWQIAEGAGLLAEETRISVFEVPD